MSDSINYPPPGSVMKIAPNATLIDLKKMKQEEFKKPFRVDEMTVLIDEKNAVKVIDIGIRIPHSIEHKLKLDEISQNNFLLETSTSEDNVDLLNDSGELDCYEEPSHEQLTDVYLGTVLQNMRNLKISCDMSIVGRYRRFTIPVHSCVMVARSSYFYRKIYLRRMKRKSFSTACRFVLPFLVEENVVEAVVTYMYTGSTTELLNKDAAAVKRLFTLFEMGDYLQFEVENDVQHEEVTEEELNSVDKNFIKREKSESVVILPIYTDEEKESSQLKDRQEICRKKRKKSTDIESHGEFGKLKVSVVKVVDSTLIPFISKIEELFDRSTTSIEPDKSPQHIVTLWHADVLLSKLFAQNDVTKFFSDVVAETLKIHGDNPVQMSCDTNNFVLESFVTHTGNASIDESYTKLHLSNAAQYFRDSDANQSINFNELQIVNFKPFDPKQIPHYAHIISMYRFKISTKNDSKKEPFMTPLLDEFSGGPVVLEDLVDGMQNEDLVYPVTRACLQDLTYDLKRRVIADLELNINPSFHEELIMHIIIDEADTNGLSISVANFLAKGCNFCRKKECRSEDLLSQITPDNPVCPDRQCIRRNLQCGVCEKQMASSKSLARHEYSVHGVQVGDTSGTFICSHCGETFSKKWKLNMHERQHEDRKMKVMCQYCKKVIHGSVALKKHISMVHETKPKFSCGFCHKSFKRRETLIVHQRIHSGEKPFRCGHCDYASETKGNLKAHFIRKHKEYFAISNETDAFHNQDFVHADNSFTNENNSYANDGELVLGNDSMVVQETGAANDDQVMAATIVAHTLSECSFIITSENADNSLVS